MKLEILQSKLKEGIIISERIVSKSITLPILNNILLVAEKNFLKLSTTDLEVGLKWWGLAKVEREGQITIPARVLSSYISFFLEEKILLETKNQILTIISDKTKTEIKGFNAEEFPIIPEAPGDKILSIDNQVFCQSLNQVADFTIPSTTKPEISGVFFQLTKDFLCLVATDSFRLGEKKIFLENASVKTPNEKILNFSFILPPKTVREIINIFGELKGEINLYLSPNQAMFEIYMTETSHPKVQLLSRLIEGDYPNYQEIIPQKFDSQIVLPKAEFLNQIKLASLFSGKINEVKLKVNPKTQEIEIFSQNPELGSHSSAISGKIKGESLEISFNYRFLIEGLANIKSSEVIFELNKEKGPGVLKPLGDQTYIYIVMPIETG